MESRRYTVSEAARLAHVTVRTLHHYDAIGLLRPSGRSPRGYRLYSLGDLERLREILLFRELDFPLEEIRTLLGAAPRERAQALRHRRLLLEERLARTRAVLEALDRALETLEGGKRMDEQEMFAGFESFQNVEYAQEARERWGETEAYRESLRRARTYSPDDWTRIRSEGEAIEARLVEVFRSGEPPEGEGAMDAVEAHRSYLDRWFFPVDHGMHRCLARMYVDDPRFRAHYDALAPGLAAFVEAAVRANALRSSGLRLGEGKGAGEG